MWGRFFILLFIGPIIFAINFAMAGGMEQNVNETIYNGASAVVAAVGATGAILFSYLYRDDDDD